MSLPYYTKLSYWVAICDIGAGGSFIRNGTYVLMWDGTGIVKFANYNVKVLSQDLSNRVSTVQFGVMGTAGIRVIISKSNVTDPVHNIRIVPQSFVSNYTKQIFQPQFLDILRPFQSIRFTAWQKITTSPKSWVTRTTPSSQTQHLADGVAIEHMVDLVRILRNSVDTVWFSFPLASSDYTNRMISLLGASLPPGLTIYYEAGSPESHGDGDRHLDSLALFSAVSVLMANYSFNLIPTVAVINYAYIPYVSFRFGPTDLSKIKAIAVPGQFGRSIYAWDNYTSSGEWSILYANYTRTQILTEIRRSVLIAEIMLNQMRNKVLTYIPNVQFVAYTGGPYLNSGSYGYRAALYVVQNCISSKKFPCVWANTKYNFSSSAAAMSALPMIRYNATLEQIVENNFILLERAPEIQQFYLELLERWNRIGGGLFTSDILVKVPLYCPTGGKNCGGGGMFESPLFTDCPQCYKYEPLVVYQQGVRSTLPFTPSGSTLPPQQHCNPACKWGTCYNATCTCFAGYSGQTCSVKTRKPNDCTNDTGINLAGLNYWSSEWAYVDKFKTSGWWVSQDFVASAWSTGTAQHLGPNGYPAYLLPQQILGTMMIRDLQTHIRNGVFICLYEGDGIITFSMDIVKIVRDVGRMEVTIKLSTGLNNGAFLTIERTNPADPIRNIRFIMPGFESTYAYFPFHPLFLHTISSYTTIRFMDWANTNGVMPGNWSQRSDSNTTYTYWSTGAPIEDMILLANTVGAAPWFNMPHLCTDDFIRRYASLVKETLRPDVKIYVEYSNEVWGTLFPGGQYAQQQGLAMGLSTSSTTARFCFYVLRSSQIFSIWKNVFGSNSRRLNFVLASQAVNPDVSNQMLRCKGSGIGGATYATTLAIAPYFGSYSATVDKDLNKFMNKTLPTQVNSITTSVLGHLQYAKRYNLTLVTYESGQGLAGSGTPSDLAIQANRDPRMSAVYVQYFSMLRNAGVKLMMHFSSTGLFSTTACWGLLEATDQNPVRSPKFVGLQSYIAMHSTCTVSDNNNRTCPYGCSGAGYCTSAGVCECYYGATGKYCEIITYTEHTDLCGYFCTFHQGTCVPSYIQGNDRYWACQCDAPYYGLQCSLFNCNNSCNFNGLCLDADLCSCYPGYSGKFCDIDCGCNGHGSCSGDKSQCVCDVGWKWSQTNASCVPDCGSATCDSSGQAPCKYCKYGTCLDGTCVCWAGYAGDSCDRTIPRPNTNSTIGTNLGGISYWTVRLPHSFLHHFL